MNGRKEKEPGSLLLKILIALLVAVAVFEISLFAIYGWDLVEGIVGLFQPTTTEVVSLEEDTESHPSTSLEEQIVSDTQEGQQGNEESSDVLQETFETTVPQVNDSNSSAPTDPSTDIESDTRPPTTSSSTSTATVYITETGSKYHSAGCQYLSDSKIPISLSSARAQGYEPCKICRHGR